MSDITASETEKNRAIMKEAYQKWHDTKGGSVDHWMEIMSPDIEFLSLANGAGDAGFTKAARSSTDMRGYFEAISTNFDMIHYTVDQFIAEGDMVVAVGSCAWTVKANGMRVETPKVDVIRLKDGKIVSFYEFYDTVGLQTAMASIPVG
ncbi:MAG: nuclear transport factor 2 family protein [Pseudomonadota bacterium]